MFMKTQWHVLITLQPCFMKKSQDRKKLRKLEIKGTNCIDLKSGSWFKCIELAFINLTKKQLYVFIPTLKISLKKPCEGKFPSHMTTNSILFIDRGLIPLLFFYIFINLLFIKNLLKEIITQMFTHLLRPFSIFECRVQTNVNQF